jgi:hypothetical protein
MHGERQVEKNMQKDRRIKPCILTAVLALIVHFCVVCAVEDDEFGFSLMLRRSDDEQERTSVQ